VTRHCDGAGVCAPDKEAPCPGNLRCVPAVDTSAAMSQMAGCTRDSCDTNADCMSDSVCDRMTRDDGLGFCPDPSVVQIVNEGDNLKALLEEPSSKTHFRLDGDFLTPTGYMLKAGASDDRKLVIVGNYDGHSIDKSTIKLDLVGDGTFRGMIIESSTHVYFDRVSIQHFESYGIEMIGSSSELYLRDSSLIDGFISSNIRINRSLSISRSSRVRLRDSQINGGIQVFGSLDVDGGTIRDWEQAPIIVNSGGQVEIRGASIESGNDHSAIAVPAGGVLSIDDSVIKGGGLGIWTDGAHVSINRSTIESSLGGGIFLVSPSAGSAIVNSVIKHNGNDGRSTGELSEFGGLRVSGGELDVIHSTFFNNTSDSGEDSPDTECGASIGLYHNVFYKPNSIVPSLKPTLELLNGCEINGSNNFIQKDAGFDALPDAAALESDNVVTDANPLLDKDAKPLANSPLIGGDDMLQYDDSAAKLIREATGGVDINGDPREQGPAPDIGAYEMP